MSDAPRPAWHFQPERTWMNDPNGLVYVDGVWHLFFQHNPFGDDWGYMSWGHAISRDLVSWTQLDTAIPWREDEQVYSGSAVVDGDAVVACYTGVSADGIQAQYLARSLDAGMTWERVPGGPVLDRGSREFRDPSVFRHGDAWILAAVEATDRRLHLYSSPDLHAWTHASEFAFADPLPGAGDVVWECPDLFPLALDGDPERVRWLLVLSTNAFREGATGGSAMHYLVGDFDGVAFTPERGAEWRRVDHGADFYAGVTFSDAPDGRRVMIGWMSNWLYARALPAVPPRGAMSVPRELSLRTVDGVAMLWQEPVAEARQAWSPVGVGGPGATRLGSAAVVAVSLPADGEWSLALADGDVEPVWLTWAAGTLTLERAAIPDVPAFAAVRSMPVPPAGAVVEFEVVVDAHLVEVFAAGRAMSHRLAVSPAGGWELRVGALA